MTERETERSIAATVSLARAVARTEVSMAVGML